MLKTSSRRLQGKILLPPKTSSWRLPRQFFQDVFKTCLQEVFLKARLEDILKTSSWKPSGKDILKDEMLLRWRHLQDFLARRLYWRRLEEDVLKIRLEDALKTLSWKTSRRYLERWDIDMRKTFSRRLGKQEMFAGNGSIEKIDWMSWKLLIVAMTWTSIVLGILFLTLSTYCFYIKVWISYYQQRRYFLLLSNF